MKAADQLAVPWHITNIKTLGDGYLKVIDPSFKNLKLDRIQFPYSSLYSNLLFLNLIIDFRIQQHLRQILSKQICLDEI